MVPQVTRFGHKGELGFLCLGLLVVAFCSRAPCSMTLDLPIFLLDEEINKLVLSLQAGRVALMMVLMFVFSIMMANACGKHGNQCSGRCPRRQACTMHDHDAPPNDFYCMCGPAWGKEGLPMTPTYVDLLQ